MIIIEIYQWRTLFLLKGWISDFIQLDLHDLRSYAFTLCVYPSPAIKNYMIFFCFCPSGRMLILSGHYFIVQKEHYTLLPELTAKKIQDTPLT